jgi:hypothetical protein
MGIFNRKAKEKEGDKGVMPGPVAQYPKQYGNILVQVKGMQITMTQGEAVFLAKQILSSVEVSLNG